MNRREFLRRTAPSAGLIALGAGTWLQGCESIPSMPEPGTRAPLRIPPATDATDALLTAGAAELDLGNHTSRAWGYNAGLPGPTLRARVAEHAHIRLLNHLAEDTTVHWHGTVVPASMDGHPADAVPPGADYGYDYPIVQRAAMNWYHRHPHGRTGRQIWRGLAGAFILEDPAAEQGLPSGEREIPLLTLIGNDGGLLEQPVEVAEIELAPAERVDILVDLSLQPIDATLSLRCRHAGWDLLDIHVAGERDDETVIPSSFAPIEHLTVDQGTRRRAFRFEGNHRIDGREYDMDRVDFRVARGETEIWEFESTRTAA